MGTNAYTRPASTAVDISERNNTEALLISGMAVNKTGIANDTYRMVIKHSDGTTVRVPVMVGTRLNTEAIIGPIGDANTQLTFSDDALNITCGGVSMMDLVEGATDYVNVPVEFRAGGLVAGGMVKADAGTGALVVATPDVDYATKEYVDLAVASITLDEFFSDTASDLGGVYKVMDNTQASSANIVSAAITTDTTTTIFSFATLSGEPGLDRLLKGIYDFHLHLLKTGNKTITIQAQLYKRILAGTETLIGTSEISEALGTTSADYDLHMVIDPEVTLLTTDRLVVKVLAISTGPAGSTTVTMAVGGASDSHFTSPVSAQSLTNIFVPYTGATADVNLGDHKFGVNCTPNFPLESKIASNDFAASLTNSLVAANSTVELGFEFGRTGGPGGPTASIKAIKSVTGTDTQTSLTINTYSASDWVEAARFTSAGLLGLGCTPSFDLHIEKSLPSSTVSAAIKNTSVAADSRASLRIYEGTGESLDIYATNTADTDGNRQFLFFSKQVQMRSDGSINIMTSDPNVVNIGSYASGTPTPVIEVTSAKATMKKSVVMGGINNVSSAGTFTTFRYNYIIITPVSAGLNFTPSTADAVAGQIFYVTVKSYTAYVGTYILGVNQTTYFIYDGSAWSRAE